MNIEREIETMLGIQAGMTAILASLIATHPNYRQLQLHLTTALEVMLEGGFAGAALSDHQRATARSYVEQLQQIDPATGEIDPLGSLGLRRNSNAP